MSTSQMTFWMTAAPRASLASHGRKRSHFVKKRPTSLFIVKWWHQPLLAVTNVVLPVSNISRSDFVHLRRDLASITMFIFVNHYVFLFCLTTYNGLRSILHMKGACTMAQNPKIVIGGRADSRLSISSKLAFLFTFVMLIRYVICVRNYFRIVKRKVWKICI